MEREENKEKEKKKSHKLLYLLLLVIILCTGLYLDAKYIGIKGLKVKEYRVESSILTSNFSGVKIVHFSDLLYKSTIDNNDIKKLVNRINELRPDIVVFTGDLVDKNKNITDSDTNFLIEQLSLIDANISKYAIYGDYDYSYDKYEDVMTASNFILLNNSYDTIYYNNNNPIYIVGFPSSIKEKTDLNKSFEFYSDENRKYTMVLVHDGKTIKALDESSYEVDLILGGHSLGGSIRIPYLGGVFIDDRSYKYYDEYYSKGLTNIYISSGIGTNNYNYRFLNKPSFNLYRLKAQSS
ncbi:MAG: metallophosphoesterase [bacterium]|nr:metallophosphoesterase [bacterium]